MTTYINTSLQEGPFTIEQMRTDAAAQSEPPRVSSSGRNLRRSARPTGEKRESSTPAVQNPRHRPSPKKKIVKTRAPRDSPDAEEGAKEHESAREEDSQKINSATGITIKGNTVKCDTVPEDILATIEDDDVDADQQSDLPDVVIGPVTKQTGDQGMQDLEEGMSRVNRNWEQMDQVGSEVDAKIEELFTEV